MPLSAVYVDHVLNSILLLLHVSIPSSARLGVGLAPIPSHDAVLALPAIRCTPEEVLLRFEALFGALHSTLVAPVFVKPGTVASVAVASLLRLLSNVRCYVPGPISGCHVEIPSLLPPLPLPLPLLLSLHADLHSRCQQQPNCRGQVACLRAPSVSDAKAHFGVDAVSKEETLSAIGYSLLLAPLKTLAITLLGDLLPVCGTHVFAFRRDLATCVLEDLAFAWHV
jgi:hypothetical protein